ncbi:hypothetical protein BGW42_008589 [Actinomortierella wolfii]|nr:hypothetical protein BGW42_008589 [Actinomortierella wolfii]
MSFNSESTLHSAHLSYAQFEHAIKQFEVQTRQYQPWSLVDYQIRKGTPTQFYLTRTEAVVKSPSVRVEHVPEISDDGDVLFGDEDHDLEEINDDAATHQGHVSEEVLSVAYHIVYSSSYQVPVLYFNAYKPNGVAISADEIYSILVPEAWRSAIRNAGLNGGISQQV